MDSRDLGTVPGSGGDDRQGLGRIIIAILLVEVLTICALYWFGQYFA